MNHEDFLNRLADIEPPSGHADGSLEDLLGAAAAGHAAACEDCARTAQALLLLSRDETALFDEPSADYWLSFDERLAGRLAALGQEATTRRTASAWMLTLRVAAVLAVAVGLAAFALHAPEDEEGSPQRAASSGAGAPVEAVDAFDDAFAAWGDESDWSAETPEAGRAFAALATDEVLPGLLRSPADSLHDELSLELDDTQAAALARSLRAEISS